MALLYMRFKRRVCLARDLSLRAEPVLSLRAEPVAAPTSRLALQPGRDYSQRNFTVRIPPIALVIF